MGAGRPRKLPPREELNKLLDEKGLTREEVAQMFGVTINAVDWQRQVTKDAKERTHYKGMMPWVVAKEHTNLMPAAMLRIHRKIIDDPTDMPTGGPASSYDRWIERLKRDDEVVGYDRELTGDFVGDVKPATAKGGWFYVKRAAEDEPWPSVVTTRDRHLNHRDPSEFEKGKRRWTEGDPE